jgi:hypothetical protein
VSEPGSTGTDWRLHYSLTLNDLRCDFFEITDVTGGETWRRIPVSPGDVLLGDRIYGTPTSIAHVLAAKGAVIARVNHHALPLFEADGSAFPMLRRFAMLRVGKPQEWPTFARHKGRRLNGRLIAVKRTAGATRRVRKLISRKASRKQVHIPQESWRLAPYFFVWTSLPDQFDPSQILKMYRLRWQIELAFKRMKSLLGFGHLPKKDPASARAWLHGKLFVGLLAEHLIVFADDLCAGQHEISSERRSRWREVGFMAHEISSSVLPRTDLATTLDQWNEIATWLGETKRRRTRQLLTDATRRTTHVER